MMTPFGATWACWRCLSRRTCLLSRPWSSPRLVRPFTSASTRSLAQIARQLDRAVASVASDGCLESGPPASEPASQPSSSSSSSAAASAPAASSSEDKALRLKCIKAVFPQPYPRIRDSADPSSPPTTTTCTTATVTCKEFGEKYDHLQPNETVDSETVVVHGRVRSARLAGSKLMFFDVLHDGSKLQILCNQRMLEAHGVDRAKFRDFYHALRPGDSYAITGNPHRTGRGELSLLATSLPRLLSPCLHTIPVWSAENEDTGYERHVELLASPTAAAVLRARSTIIQTIRQFFLERSFLEVSTPIMAAAAGGAVARPFATRATELPDEPLALRIAPELWLKRLVVGGFDRVFEIGPSFRNEGVDRTHNPEFTTCEFYQVFADLEALMETTEELFRRLDREVQALNERVGGVLSPAAVDFARPFKRLDFIPAIEAAIGQRLPQLDSPDATAQVQALLGGLAVPLPSELTLPRLLDKLCGEYLEPQCESPTFIVNHPECLSPLSKSFVHPTTAGQRVAARAELFIGGREVVNLYEEENSPDEQRAKFQRQLDTRDSENASRSLDERFLECLEWGLPPTGGWGCGIERLTMLFTGARRIDDVLPFGNLRSVARASR